MLNTFIITSRTDIFRFMTRDDKRYLQNNRHDLNIMKLHMVENVPMASKLVNINTSYVTYLCDSKICDFECFIIGQQQVTRFDVFMNDTLAVQVF